MLALSPPALWAIRDVHVGSTGSRSGAGRLMENILLGSEPDFIPRYKDNAGKPAAVAARQRIDAEEQEFAIDPGRAVAQVWTRLRSDPGRYTWWYLSKPFAFWDWSILQGYGDVYVYPMVVAPFDDYAVLRALASLCHGFNGVVMIAAFLGVLLLFATPPWPDSSRIAVATMAALFVYSTGVHSILMPDARYAVPFRPFELILALFAANVLFDAAQRRRMRALVNSAG
jgi:hypothetical protein